MHDDAPTRQFVVRTKDQLVSPRAGGAQSVDVVFPQGFWHMVHVQRVPVSFDVGRKIVAQSAVVPVGVTEGVEEAVPVSGCHDAFVGV